MAKYHTSLTNKAANENATKSIMLLVALEGKASLLAQMSVVKKKEDDIFAVVRQLEMRSDLRSTQRTRKNASDYDGARIIVSCPDN